jgi:hypothetical protein
MIVRFVQHLVNNILRLVVSLLIAYRSSLATSNQEDLS